MAMHFRPSQTPPHQDRQLQRRMLGYVAVIAVVMVAFQLLPAARRSAGPPPAPGGKAPDQMDFRVRQDAGSPLEPDEFRAPPDLDGRDPAPPSREPEVFDLAADPQLDRARLSAVRDNTLGIRADESEAFFYVLDHVRRVPGSSLERAAKEGVQYVNLMSDSTLFRGEPVTIVGDLWGLYEFPASANPYGLTRLYEAWIFTNDSSTHPYRIVATGLGDDLKPGHNQRTPVRVTGYFFKREGYESKGGLHVAPTLLARRITRYRSPSAPPPADGLAPIMLGVVVAIGLILSATLISFAWNDRRQPRLQRSLPEIPRDTVRRLEALDLRSVPEQLRELAERERSGQPLWDPASSTEPKPATNGQPKAGEEYVELPTPFPPTRTLRPDNDSTLR
jgi:hypothetical protein